MDDIVSFGYWVRRRRKAMDLTQVALAGRVGCATVTIKKIERDERRPSREMADLLADHLAIPDAERDTFVRMARGEFVTGMASPLDDVPPLAFPEGGEEPAGVEEAVFVAREAELAQLEEFLDRALSGGGRVVFVTGEAGSGKTALVGEFSRRAQERLAELVVVGGNCNAYTGVGDPYLPFREALGLLAGDVEARLAAGAISREQAHRLWSLMPHTVQALVNAGPDLIDVFVPGSALVKRAAVAAPGGSPWRTQLEELVARRAAAQSPASLQQSDLFEQYTRVLAALAMHAPLVLILDDLQWADAGSINLLFHLGRRLEGERVLILGVYRPADVALGRPSASSGERERHPLEPVVGEFQRHFGEIQVDLRQTADRGFVDALLDSEPNRLGDSFRDALYGHARGHALFTVEMLRGMQERGDLVRDEDGRWTEGPALDWETLPARVEGAIGERIHRLPPGLQETLKTASVEGEFFTAEVLARARAVDEPAMVQQLSGELDRQHHLVKSQSSRQIGPGGGRLSQYRFRHILFQRYLYSGLDDVERAYLHETVGSALEELHQGGTEEAAVQLAWHFEMAGSAAKAAGYLRQAGERAVRLSAHEEAIAHFARALELLETLPDPSQYAQEELSLQTALGHALIVIKGSAAPEVEVAFARARELCQGVGETPQLFQVLWGLHTYYLVRGKIHPTALELAGQLLDLAESLGDPALIIAARYALGSTLFWTGDHAQAQTHLEKGMALHDLHETSSLIPHYGQDPGVMCRRYLAWANWFLGYPDQAMKVIRETISLAQELDHPFTLAGAEAIALNIEVHRREEAAVKERAEGLIALSTEHGFLLWKITASTHRGWALVGRGRREEGLEQIRQGVEAWNDTGARGGDTIHRSLLVEAHLRMGQVAEGLEVLEKSLARIEETGERYMEAEYHRLKGELLLLGGADEDEVEAQFFKAIDTARRQSARSLELRATASLCRFWMASGKKEEARRTLAEIYGWFTEGFDTPDMKEARELLDAIDKGL